MKKNDAHVWDDPGEVMAQVDTWVWLVGNMNTDNYIDEDTVWGLFLIGNMVAENVRAMINNLSPGSLGEDEKEDILGKSNEA
jgi:hypothetical protein